MEKFESLDAVAAPYPKPNVDTDMIIRIERCARTPREEMGRWAFEMERLLPDGGENPAFVLNRAPYRDARILVCGPNFGCGSSREMAVWAIAGLGVRCLIAPSFGEIFRGNCYENGVLPIVLPADVVERLAARLAADDAGARLEVDLRAQRIDAPWGESIPFEIEPLRREQLLAGLDAIGATMGRAARIDAFQAKDRLERPWIHDGLR